SEAHRRQVRIGEVAREVPCRIDVGAPRALDGEADGVVDVTGRDLAPAHETGRDRQAGRVRRGPAGGPDAVRAQAPDRAGAGVPTAAGAMQRVQLVQLAGRGVDDQRVPVAAAFEL